MVVKSVSLFGKELIRIERNRQGQFTYSFLDGNSFVDNGKYLQLSLENPVLMTIIALRASLYSQMKIKHVNSKGVEIENSDILKLLSKPNYFQSQNDWLYQQMWFLSCSGTNLIYQKRAFKNDLPKAVYNLIPSEIELNNAHKVDKFIVTDKDFKAFGERKIKYTLDGTVYDLPLSELVPLYDLSNGLTNNSFFQSPSRVKGIVKVLNNIEQNLCAKNINLQMSQKYLSKNQSNGNEAQIQDADRSSIESKLDRKNLIVTNANIDVQHLVTNMKNLYLDEQFADDANKCLLAFEMNKQMLDYFAKTGGLSNSGTLIETGLVSYIQNSLQSTADNTMNSLSQQWGLIDKREKLVASYDHLAIMQNVVNNKITSFKLLQDAIKLGIENHTISPEEAKQMSNELKLKLGL